MPEIELWKVFVSLGVPGVALGVFYLLLRGMNFQFQEIPARWAGVVVVIFIIVTASVVLYTLTLWAPSPEEKSKGSEMIQSANHHLEVLDRNQTFSESAKRNIIASDGTFLAYIVDIPGDGRNVQLRIKGDVHIYTKPDEPFIINTENKNYQIRLLDILGNESKSIVVDILKKSN